MKKFIFTQNIFFVKALEISDPTNYRAFIFQMRELETFRVDEDVESVNEGN